MRFFIIISSLVLFFFRCKKSEDSVSPAQSKTTTDGPTGPTYDTIYPKSYYPIYPGSFWKYKVNDTSEETFNSSSTYLLNRYKKEDGVTYSDTVYVTFLNDQPVYGYDHFIWNPPYFFDVRRSFLSETVGDYFPGSYTDPRTSSYGHTSDIITVIEKTKRGVDSVITTKREYKYDGVTQTLYYTEYTKDIGITKYCILGATLDTTYKKVLVDYFINR